MPGACRTSSPFELDERMAVIGTEGFIHIQDTFPSIAVCSARRASESPDTTYWPELHGITGGTHCATNGPTSRDCVREGTRPAVITPEDGDGGRCGPCSPPVNRRPAARW